QQKASADLQAANAKTAIAVTQQQRAEQLKREADIQRIASSSLEVAARNPSTAVLVADQAVDASLAGRRVFSAEVALRHTLAGLGGEAIEAIDAEGFLKGNIMFSPNGKWLVATAPDVDAVCDSTQPNLQWKRLGRPASITGTCNDPEFGP